jgi:hypothetical protein
MIELRWVIAALLFALFIWLATMNAMVFWNTFIHRKKTSSWIPIIGGIFGMLSLIIVPIASAKRWWWLPLVVDWGSIPGILVSIIYGVVIRPLTQSRRN